MLLGVNIAIYLFSFLCIWYGAGLIVSSVDHFSRRLHLSAFAISFIVLGVLTSIPEFAIGLTAVAEHDPEIFVGNLLGGLPVLFLLVIPLLAILGRGINLKHQLDSKSLLVTIIVILLPSVLILDKKITTLEGVFFLVIYGLLLVFIGKNHGIFDRSGKHHLNRKAYSYRDMLKVLVGIGIVFVSSQVIVDRTLYFSESLAISSFSISFLALSLGTNLPELFIAIRSIVWGKKDVAFGDYMGSASANTMLFGLFTLLSHGQVVVATGFFSIFVLIATGLSLFFIFSRSKNAISRMEGVMLLLVYGVFMLWQLFKP